jgi:hypothetical protein
MRGNVGPESPIYRPLALTKASLYSGYISYQNYHLETVKHS